LIRAVTQSYVRDLVRENASEFGVVTCATQHSTGHVNVATRKCERVCIRPINYAEAPGQIRNGGTCGQLPADSADTRIVVATILSLNLAGRTAADLDVIAQREQVHPRLQTRLRRNVTRARG